VNAPLIPANPTSTFEKVGVGNVALIHLKSVLDSRGNLIVGEFGSDIPFLAKRFFLICDSPGESIRGEHAHKECHQFLLCNKGSCTISVDDGLGNKKTIELQVPNIGLHIPPMIWAQQQYSSEDTQLLVLASELYEAEDYIRSYTQFCDIAKAEYFDS
jgi:dTDP-4-dehydrorhamnose 3,5-epimerase-like enzyme